MGSHPQGFSCKGSVDGLVFRVYGSGERFAGNLTGASKMNETRRTYTRQELRVHPATAYWLRDLLHTLDRTDPVDALNALDLVCDALRAELGEGSR